LCCGFLVGNGVGFTVIEVEGGGGVVSREGLASFDAWEGAVGLTPPDFDFHGSIYGKNACEQAIELDEEGLANVCA
jgi:hypothetical protein